MRVRLWIGILVAVIAAAGLFELGRGTAGSNQRGVDAARSQGYADGLRDGRATQATLTLPADQQGAARDAFEQGYAAGANDVFVGYDGGWGLSEPYVVVLVHGDHGITYRIASRTPLQDGVNYHLCPRSRTLCQEPRR